jgi:hypothetical protein
MVPTAVGLALTLMTMSTKQPLYFFFNLYLYIPQWFLWCFQYYFQVARPDPICQLYHTWAFPSVEAFYVASLVTLFVLIVYVWDIDHSWFTWVLFIVFGLAPPLVLIWTSYNRWWEVLFSVLFGVLSTAVFVALWCNYMVPNLPYWQNYSFLWLCAYEDNICMSKEQQQLYAQIRDEIKAYDRANY